MLPERFREQFLNKYAAAAEAARRPEGYQALHDLLRLWRLTAVAYSEPGFEARLASVQQAVLADTLEGQRRSRRCPGLAFLPSTWMTMPR